MKNKKSISCFWKITSYLFHDIKGIECENSQNEQSDIPLSMTLLRNSAMSWPLAPWESASVLFKCALGQSGFEFGVGGSSDSMNSLDCPQQPVIYSRISHINGCINLHSDSSIMSNNIPARCCYLFISAWFISSCLKCNASFQCLKNIMAIMADTRTNWLAID